MVQLLGVHESKATRLLLSYLYEAYRVQDKYPNFEAAEAELVRCVESGEQLSDAFHELVVMMLAFTSYQTEFIELIGLEESKLRMLVPALISAARSEFRYVTSKQAGEMLGVSDNTIRAKNIPGSTLTGGLWLIPIYYLIQQGVVE